MGNVREPLAVKFFVGILTAVPELLSRVEELLATAFGPVDLRSPLYPFESTRYYDEEMGTPLVRQFLGFERLVPPDSLAAAKRRTNDVEMEFLRLYTLVRRPVNLDPGYLEQGKIVLASTKNFSHRVYLSGGIFAEATLYFEGRQWRSFPWTFPDYRDGRYDPFFHALRKKYRDQLRQ